MPVDTVLPIKSKGMAIAEKLLGAAVPHNEYTIFDLIQHNCKIYSLLLNKNTAIFTVHSFFQ
jgi:hypothetical protein